MSTTDSNMEDLQSLTLIRQGGKMRDQGVAALYRKYAGQFRKFFLYQRLNAADADDIVQKTFFNIDKHCKSYRGDAPPAAWLWRIARNCMNDYFDHVKKRPSENLDDEGWDALVQERQSKPRPDLYAGTSLNPDMHTSDSPPSNETLEDCMDRCFAEFAKNFSECAHVFSLIKDGLDTAHIANIKQCKPGTMRERISQCYKRAREFFGPCQELRSIT